MDNSKTVFMLTFQRVSEGVRSHIITYGIHEQVGIYTNHDKAFEAMNEKVKALERAEHVSTGKQVKLRLFIPEKKFFGQFWIYLPDSRRYGYIELLQHSTDISPFTCTEM